jgi:hypothetical protein
MHVNQTERDVLRVDVPVGFLLPDQREILVSVDRPADSPLSIRLRLIPAEVEGVADIGTTPCRSSDDTPLPIRRLSRRRPHDGYAEHEYGGGD